MAENSTDSKAVFSALTSTMLTDSANVGRNRLSRCLYHTLQSTASHVMLATSTPPLHFIPYCQLVHLALGPRWQRLQLLRKFALQDDQVIHLFMPGGCLRQHASHANPLLCLSTHFLLINNSPSSGAEPNARNLHLKQCAFRQPNNDHNHNHCRTQPAQCESA
jgi:hypothetical protein